MHSLGRMVEWPAEVVQRGIGEGDLSSDMGGSKAGGPLLSLGFRYHTTGIYRSG